MEIEGLLKTWTTSFASEEVSTGGCPSIPSDGHY
jgi:hypothetical protein